MRWFVAAAVVGMALAVGGWNLIHRHQERQDGPIGADYNGRIVVGLDDVNVGDVLTYSQVRVHNRGQREAILRSVELIGDVEAVESGPALVAGVDRTLGGMTMDRQFPPQPRSGFSLGLLAPLEGAVVPPAADDPKHLGVMILLKIRVKDGRPLVFAGLRVHYEVDGQEYEYVDPTGMFLCPTTCPGLSPPEVADLD